MTARALNPFPDYAVTRLLVGQEAGGITVVTGPIKRGRELVERYLSGVPRQTDQQNAALCAVRGDYGTGKTHLLNDIASTLAYSVRKRDEEAREAANKRAAAALAMQDQPDDISSLLKASARARGGEVSPPATTTPEVSTKLTTPPDAPPAPPLTILRVTCIDTDALSWFCAKVGPQLEKSELSAVVLRLYGRAGEVVAAKVGLTEAAANKLHSDPTQIRELIRENRLSVDDVDREFRLQLGSICSEYDQVVIRVIAGLVSAEREGAARKWISGFKLLAREAELLGVSDSISSADQASSVVGAIAAIHRAIARPFVFLVDEFEHFTRYDKAHNSGSNVTWLKRLLEELGNEGALAVIAGHWDSWETTKDYLDRFPQYAPIDLIKLEASEVRTIAATFLGAAQAHLFDDEIARVVAQLTNGNMRRVMSLCGLLFRESKGFTVRLSAAQIQAAWMAIAQRVPQQQALDQIADQLETRGFTISQESSFAGIPFDLVAERTGAPHILVQAKHASTQIDHYNSARKFIDKLRLATRDDPRATGIFLANGSIDDELNDILRGAKLPRLHWIDLTTRNALEKIREVSASASDQLVPSGSVPGNPPQIALPESESVQLRAVNAALENKLQELDLRRMRETHELTERLERLARVANSPRENSTRTEIIINPERERAGFEALLAQPPLRTKIKYLGPSLITAFASFGLGVIIFLGKDLFLYDIIERERFAPLLNIYGLVFIAGGAWILWRRYSRVLDYFDFSRQVIQELYLRDVSISVLQRINTNMRGALDRHGVMKAREAAIAKMMNAEFPPSVKEYFSDLSAN